MAVNMNRLQHALCLRVAVPDLDEDVLCLVGQVLQAYGCNGSASKNTDR